MNKTERKKGFPTQLDKGSYGSAVNLLVDKLHLNFDPEKKLVADGIFGEQVEEAVKRFQRFVFRDENQVDGRFGKKTQEEFKKYFHIENLVDELEPFTRSWDIQNQKGIIWETYDTDDEPLYEDDKIPAKPNTQLNTQVDERAKYDWVADEMIPTPK